MLMWLADACHSDRSQDGLKEVGLGGWGVGGGDERERKKETPQGFSEEGGEGEDLSN